MVVTVNRLLNKGTDANVLSRGEGGHQIDYSLSHYYPFSYSRLPRQLVRTRNCIVSHLTAPLIDGLKRGLYFPRS